MFVLSTRTFHWESYFTGYIQLQTFHAHFLTHRIDLVTLIKTPFLYQRKDILGDPWAMHESMNSVRSRMADFWLMTTDCWEHQNTRKHYIYFDGRTEAIKLRCTWRKSPGSWRNDWYVWTRDRLPSLPRSTILLMASRTLFASCLSPKKWNVTSLPLEQKWCKFN